MTSARLSRKGSARLPAHEHVELRSRSLRGFSHLVSSRQGLFAVDEGRWSLLVEGQFFGLSQRGDAWFAFESCDRPSMPTRGGRIVRFQLLADQIVHADVVAADLDNGCHQIDFIGERLCVLDTYQQRVIVFSSDFCQREYRYPLPPASRNDWAGGYLHCNSLLQLGERILLVLHNGGVKTHRPSRILVTDASWQPTQHFLLPGLGCHNVVMLEDGELLSCGSLSGELITTKRVVAKVDTMMTRGLSVDPERIVVGASVFATQRERVHVPGRVHFLDRTYRIRATLELPAAPTDVRRIDACDLSLSRYATHTLTQSDLDAACAL